jgi:hypothetical protein
LAPFSCLPSLPAGEGRAVGDRGKRWADGCVGVQIPTYGGQIGGRIFKRDGRLR